MTDAGIKGIDLYTKRNNNWYYTNTCLPNGKENEQILFEDIEKKNREYCLYLPLYDTLIDMQIGLDDDSSLEKITFKNKTSGILRNKYHPEGAHQGLVLFIRISSQENSDMSVSILVSVVMDT